MRTRKIVIPLSVYNLIYYEFVLTFRETAKVEAPCESGKKRGVIRIQIAGF